MLRVLRDREGLIIATFLIIVAVIGKIIAGFTVFGQPDLNKLAIGVGMIPRGEVGLVFVAVGATSGVLSSSLEAGIVVMVIFTTFIAPALLRVVFSSEETEEVASEVSSVVEPEPTP
ncbi:cation:proton antiporter [Pleurocapsales cyanobacterium LEGE 10410]|nr:cation:proton antiporter [Pleurocapsales cyanobacterium LEGE 10410]